jgi:phosphopantothenoylcysteine decarboxylase / phosphopantothenate---cysteine ligase
MSEAEQQWLRGTRVVVTAGGTRESVDTVRFLGNRSSGKMGVAIARAARRAGADVTLITAAETTPALDGVTLQRVESAADMLDAVRAAIPGADVLLMSAAVADYRPEHTSPSKLKKRDQPWDLRLVPTADILRTLRDAPERRGVFVVGFAAETDDLLANADRKLREKGLDLIVLNDVSRPDIGMGADDNEVTVIDAAGVVETIARAPKDVVAQRLLQLVAGRIR